MNINNLTKKELIEMVAQLQAQLRTEEANATKVAEEPSTEEPKEEPKAVPKKVVKKALEVLPTVEPNRRVEITSLVEGTLTVKTYCDIYQLPYKGSTEIVTFEELRKLKNSNRGYFDNMMFKINDMDVIKVLKLDKQYGTAIAMAENPIEYFSNPKLKEETALADYKLLPQSMRMNIIGSLIKAWATEEFVDYDIRNFFKKYYNIDIELEAEELIESGINLSIE